MNIANFVMMALMGLQLIEDPATNLINNTGQACITSERISKPSLSWKVLKTEIEYDGKNSFLEISVHNPLNKKIPNSVDARFILSVDLAHPMDAQKYNLITATYYNIGLNVTFKRIYIVNKAKLGKRIKKVLIQTPCFSREVLPIINFEPEKT